MTQDPSLHTDALFGSNDWAARRLGRSKDWFFRHREKLESRGFPKPDPVVGYYLKSAVDEWIAKRAPQSCATVPGSQGENLRAL